MISNVYPNRPVYRFPDKRKKRRIIHFIVRGGGMSCTGHTVFADNGSEGNSGRESVGMLYTGIYEMRCRR